MKRRTLQDWHDEWERTVMPKGAGPQQREDMSLSFWCGMVSLWTALGEADNVKELESEVEAIVARLREGPKKPREGHDEKTGAR